MRLTRHQLDVLHGAGLTSHLSCRPRISGPSPQVASTASTTGCYLGRTSTPSSTADTWALTPRYRLLVSPRLREDFGNGDQLYSKAGQIIYLPERRADRPQRDFLEWHLDEVFKAS